MIWWIVVDPIVWSGREGKRKGRQDEAAPAEARFFVDVFHVDIFEDFSF